MPTKLVGRICSIPFLHRVLPKHRTASQNRLDALKHVLQLVKGKNLDWKTRYQDVTIDST
jgi:hypothetical protein